jgi:hypothetical protein
MDRWGLTDPELLKTLDEDPELVRMVEHHAAENGETPNEMLSRLARAQLAKELDTAFASQPGSRHRRLFAEMLGEDEPFFDPDNERIDEL